MSRQTGKAKEEDLIAQLTILFPDGDPAYFEHCLSYYQVDHVERIADKIFELGGYYPKAPHPRATKTEKWNAALRILATVLFPDTDLAYLRSLIRQFHHSHVEQVTTYILQQQHRHIHIPERLDFGQLQPADTFRSDAYKNQTLLLLYNDFPQVWKSSIRAVVAENNWDYVHSYDQLTALGSGGLLQRIRHFFLNWSFHGSPQASSSSMEVCTPDLDSELQLDVTRLWQRRACQQVLADQSLAHQLNQDDYHHLGQAITCDCCFDDYPFEQLVFCSQGTHGFCHSCLVHFVTEGLFGQGGLRGATRFACIAADAEPCPGCLPADDFEHRVLTADLWKAYELSVLEANLAIPMAQGMVVRCSACGYGELDESTTPFISIIGGTRPFLFVAHLFNWDLEKDLQLAYGRILQKRRGFAFQCRNPICGKLTCLNCLHAIRGLHACWENELDGMRLYVEKAMADAVKRTCPRCSLSFQKSDGCNKITCQCGYIMCYVCRKHIGKESYGHFCDHFRETPGPCKKCKRCDLYKTDPEEQTVQQAALHARREYMNAHPSVAPQMRITIGPQSRLDQIRKRRASSNRDKREGNSRLNVFLLKF
ncbi:hypothetical protein DM01DRAFT_1408005 [Hesseltinella vesiculosa]|uniref:RING-type domain-containing protein n=1 Tax=Hesseltinella vesiculosa TaxID=101127 RepID=A0A1X2GFH9_9FUNG|nr:hypothetical protein DM01DRAFT_1408005 [Hesseltinella vesiculosa]